MDHSAASRLAQHQKVSPLVCRCTPRAQMCAAPLQALSRRALLSTAGVVGGAAACLPSLAREDLSDAFRKDTRALSDALTKYMTLVRIRPLAVSFLPLTFPLVACTAARRWARSVSDRPSRYIPDCRVFDVTEVCSCCEVDLPMCVREYRNPLAPPLRCGLFGLYIGACLARGRIPIIVATALAGPGQAPPASAMAQT